MSDLDKILTNGKGKLPDDKLLAYIEGRLSPEEQHEVEAWLAEEGMEADAVDGLSHLQVKDARESVQKLNYQLYQKTGAKKHRKLKPFSGGNWALIAIVVIILLCIAGYVVLHLMVRK